MSSNEGLDVDDLDVEVPTAAYRIGEPGWRKLLWGEKQLKVESGYDSFKETKEASEEIEKFEHKELVTREKMREALREAVQQAQQRERRRIQDKIRNRIDNLRTSNLRPVEVSVIKDKLEELEEEVSEE